MPKIIIADTSVLIVFQKINYFHMLKDVYEELLISTEVFDEFAEQIPHWIKIHPISDKKYQQVLETIVDLGEASVIALAKEFDDPLLLLDDLKARRLAVKLGIKLTGTLGIIYKAKQMSIIDKVKPVIDKLLDTDFRISETIIKEFLKLNGE